MIGIALIVLIAAGIVVAMRHSTGGDERPRRVARPGFAQLPRLRADLDRWVAAGLLTEAQSAAILAHDRDAAGAPQRHPARPRTGVPVVAEALGYLGGVLAITGAALVLSRAWSDLTTPGRLLVSGVAAVALVTGGALVHEARDPALARLRWFLWLLSSAAVALFAGVVADGFDASDEAILLAAAAAVAVESALLWQLRVRPLQHLTTLAGLAVAAGASVALVGSSGTAGLAVWAVGAAFVVAGLRWARLPLPPLSESVGAVAAVVGAIMAASQWQGFGLPFLVLTGAALLAVVEVPGLLPAGRSAVPLVLVGLLTLAQAVPTTITYFARQAGIATGMVTWAIGGLLVLIAYRESVRTPIAAQAFGGLAMLAGAAVTAAQSDAFAPVFGLLTSIGLVALGTLPGQVLLSAIGSLGLLVNVPWAIGRYFPGEARAPLLIFVAGLVILAVAVGLARMGGRFRDELGGHRHHGPPPAAAGL